MSEPRVVTHTTYKVGLLHLPKLVSIFYEAGYWIARAQASHIKLSSAYTGDQITRDIGWCVTHFYNPDSAQTMNVVTDPISESVGQGLLDQFLTLLAESPVDAMAFAASVELRRKAAINRLIGLEQIAGDHDRALARAATQTMHDLTMTMEICGIAFAVGTCVLSLAILPAVGVITAGVSANAAGATAFGISTLSSVILAKIKSANDPKAMQACAISTAENVPLLVGGMRADTAADKYKEAALKQKEIYKHTQRLSDKLQQLAGKKVSLWQKSRIQAARIAPGVKGAAAQIKAPIYKAGQYAAKGVSGVFAVIGLYNDIKTVITEADENNKIVNQGNDG